MLQKINKQIKGQKFFEHMTEIRGEAVHVWCPENLKVWERKEIKDNYQAVQTDKNEWLHSFICIH